MVIFGAGASFDSSSTHHPGTGPLLTERLPLARELFEERQIFIDSLDKFPQCKTVVYRLRDPQVISGQKSIEAILLEIEKEASTYRRGNQELAAIRCYLQRVISKCQQNWWNNFTHGVTNQLGLLREIDRTQKDAVCLVTFNYDTLLEDAMTELGYGITNIGEYTERNVRFLLFKLHGSVNWAREIKPGIPDTIHKDGAIILSYVIDNLDQFGISNVTELCEPMHMGWRGNVPVFPVIAIPIEKKDLFECPPYMVQKLRMLIPKVTKILVIGWRATEDNFFELLNEHLQAKVPVYIVAGNEKDAQDISVTIHRKLVSKAPITKCDSGGFTDFMRDGRAVEFLRT